MKIYKLVLIALILINATIWLAVFTYEPKLAIIACDVGQGDATLIIKGGNQILIDGGPNEAVLTCLGRHMPFWDRKIELIILTHPQADHYRGLIAVTSRYNFQTLFWSEAESSSQDYQVLKNQVGSGGKGVVINQEVIHARLGKIYLDMFHQSGFSKINPQADPNEMSLVTLIRHENFKTLFTGDASISLLEKFINQGYLSSVNYLKVPHHGSKTGLSENIVVFLKPNLATISVGDNNRYGHPDKEVIDLLSRHKVKTFRTDLDGEIKITFDEKDYQVFSQRN